MDEQRALLDSLMGRNRDGDRPEEDISDFRHPRVCKPFLCGLCPHELFQNTKMDLGACAQLHLPKLKDAYEAQRLARDCGYELELERELAKYLADVDRKIRRAQRRLEEQEGVKPLSLLDAENSTEVLALTNEIQDALERAEEAGNEGEVDLSVELMKTAETLKQKMADVQASAMIKSIKAEAATTRGAASDEPDAESASDGAASSHSSGKKPQEAPSRGGASVNQRLRVCDVCGAFLSIYDSDRRLADHFGGKLHLGYVLIRKKVKEMAELRRERRQQQAGGGIEARDRGRKDGCAIDKRRDSHDRRSRSTSRPLSRSRREEPSAGNSQRSRDRAHGRDKGSGRDRPRGRDRRRSETSNNRSRRRHRHRSTSPSRSRSKSRTRSRSSSRSRSRDRGRRR